MTEQPTPREVAQLVVETAGIPDAAVHEEALTRLIATGARGGWNSLTQADFDGVQDAFDDATGQPRRKRKNPLLWKIGFWWHWHVTSPIVYPVVSAPGDLLAYLRWHLWSKRHGAQTLVAYRGEDGEVYLKTMPWTAHRDQCAAEGTPLPNEFARLLGRPFDRFRKHTAYGWDCPPCRIHAGDPANPFPTELAAAAGLSAHVRDSHHGEKPDDAWADQISWRGNART